jgi:alpha-ketoglutarate-dependent taurine dioxygenase
MMSIEPLVEARIPEDRSVEGRVFPLTLTPAEGDRPASTERLVAWIQANNGRLLERAMEHGAVLLRGFAVETADDFARVVEALDLENMPYIGGAAVRTRVSGDRVLTANEAPPSEPIPFHHEMAQVPEPPDHVIFYCDVPPAAGGETPIVLSNQVYRFASERYAAFLRRVEALGVRYTRVLPEEDDPTSAIGRSWRSTYQAQTRADAEARMRALGTTWAWLPSGDLRTVTATLPAIREERRTGQKTFFNSMIAAYTGWVDARNDPTKAVELGDGSPVDREAMLGIAEHMREARVAFAWHKGDVLIIDNQLTMHARSPFTPPRRILASVLRARRDRGVESPEGPR